MVELQRAIVYPEILLAQTSLSVPGLMPPTYDIGGKIKTGDNLQEKLSEIDTLIAGEDHSWYQRLVNDVMSSRKSAIFKIAVGSIIVFAATGAGFEFGIRHGRDIRELHGLVEKFRSERKK